ncbi:hypothetical protein [Spirosoma humi]
MIKGFAFYSWSLPEYTQKMLDSSYKTTTPRILLIISGHLFAHVSNPGPAFIYQNAAPSH